MRFLLIFCVLRRDSVRDVVYFDLRAALIVAVHFFAVLLRDLKWCQERFLVLIVKISLAFSSATLVTVPCLQAARGGRALFRRRLILIIFHFPSKRK